MAEQLKMRGNIYMLQEKMEGCQGRRRSREAIRLSPKDAELAGWLGHVDIELRQFPAAISILLNQVYTQDPQSVEALRDLGNAFYFNENYAEALSAMDQLAKLETPRPGSWFFRAICYDKLSRKVEAIDAYQKFLDLDKGEHDTQDFQARHRILTLQGELGQTPKKQKK